MFLKLQDPISWPKACRVRYGVGLHASDRGHFAGIHVHSHSIRHGVGKELARGNRLSSLSQRPLSASAGGEALPPPALSLAIWPRGRRYRSVPLCRRLGRRSPCTWQPPTVPSIDPASWALLSSEQALRLCLAIQWMWDIRPPSKPSCCPGRYRPSGSPRGAGCWRRARRGVLRCRSSLPVCL